MKRRILLRIGVTFVFSLAIFLFYLINVKVVNYQSAEYRRIVIRGRKDLQLFILNKGVDELAQAVYEHERLTFESEIGNHLDEGDSSDNEEKRLSSERFEWKHQSLSDDGDQVQEEFYYDNSIPYHGKENAKRDRFTEPHLTPVLSRNLHVQRKQVVHLCVVVCEDRANEALTMLKSAATVTKNASLVFHIIADESRQTVMQMELEKWPKEYSSHISYFIYNVTYFEGTAWDAWKNLYKPCAIQRVFLPDRLLSVESLIYVDTDTVFLNSLVGLWNYFDQFNSTQLISLVRESEDGTAGWYNRFASHPYYGEFGVNSGVMLMNLTRLRKTQWLADMQSIYQKYRLSITWGDQDLINIYFSIHPEQLFMVPCEWNYRTDHCMYVSNCKTAEKEGVSLLHGSRGSFYKDKEPAFQAIHQAFQKYNLGDSVKLHLLPSLQLGLKKAASSNCVKVQAIFLHHILKLASLDHPHHVSNASLYTRKDALLPNHVLNNGKAAIAMPRSNILNKIWVKGKTALVTQPGNRESVRSKSMLLSKLSPNKVSKDKDYHVANYNNREPVLYNVKTVPR